MKTQDFTQTLTSSQTPEQVFAIIKDPRKWWSGVYGETFEGSSDKLNDEFIFRAGNGAHFSKQKLVELVPGKKITWLVTDSKLDFLNDKTEWTGTQLNFDIAQQDGKTTIVFTHKGLTPKIECFGACSSGWSRYLQERLLPLINTAKK